jgi:hypothetical protein
MQQTISLFILVAGGIVAALVGCTDGGAPSS